MLCNTDEQQERAVLMERRTDSGTYEIIRHADGGYRIALNGEVLNVFCWKSNEFEDCRRTLQLLMGSRHD